MRDCESPSAGWNTTPVDTTACRNGRRDGTRGGRLVPARRQAPRRPRRAAIGIRPSGARDLGAGARDHARVVAGRANGGVCGGPAGRDPRDGEAGWRGTRNPADGGHDVCETDPQWTARRIAHSLPLARRRLERASGRSRSTAEIPGDTAFGVTSAVWSTDNRIAFTRADSLFVRETDGTLHAIARIPRTRCAWSPNARFMACAAGDQYYAAAGTLFFRKSIALLDRRRSCERREADDSHGHTVSQSLPGVVGRRAMALFSSPIATGPTTF